MIGTRLGHYHVTHRLGAGGMGEVYRADDTRLGREVALKVLPRDVADDPDRLDRFEREALALAALDHPGIVHIYSVDSADVDGRTVRFLTMQLVHGRRLADVILRRGMACDTLLDIAIPLTQALAAAHDAGVVHRDLKPTNVMVSDDGRVKVLDFGLAKLDHDAPVPESSMAPTDLLTEHGKVLGTIPYMSPEQVMGREIDARSDLFSLGVTLYEMTTGELPFHGDSAAELIASIVKDTPSDVAEIRDGCPRDLARIIRRCLEKDPRRRFQSALDVHNELVDLRNELDSAVGSRASSSGDEVSGAAGGSHRSRWIAAVGVAVVATGLVTWALRGHRAARDSEVAGPVAAAEVRSIAVLPFADMSPDGDQQYFSDGLAEELLNLLARTDGMQVAARTSSFSFRDSDLDAATIGERLGVDHLLEGSVRKAGSRVRITAQLINAANGFHLWSDTYDRKLDDIFAVQDEIARAVAGALEVTLLGGNGDPVPSRSTSVEAYNLFLQGRFLAQRRLDSDDFERAIDYLRRATELDPEYALAWAGLAYARVNQTGEGYVSYETGHPAAVVAIQRALELDPDLAYAWAVLGELRMELEWDWDGAAAALERARRLAPDDPAVIRRQAELAISLGELDRAIELATRATELDPLNYLPFSVLQYAYRNARRFDEAEAALDRMEELTGGQGGSSPSRANLEAFRGNYDAAFRAADRLYDPSYRSFLRALIFALMGRTSDALTELQAYLDGDEIWPTDVAAVYAVLGDTDASFEWLDRAWEVRDYWLPDVMTDPSFVNLHDDPRWTELLEKLDLAG